MSSVRQRLPCELARRAEGLRRAGPGHEEACFGKHLGVRGHRQPGSWSQVTGATRGVWGTCGVGGPAPGGGEPEHLEAQHRQWSV